MNPMLSLVVPVYNVAPFLERCMASLAAQDLDGMEIVCVDDGSTDDCPAILASYAARHAQIRVIRQENGGLSAARNTGLAHISGEYVAFVDSDDWIEPGYYRRLLDLARTKDLDMAHSNAMYHFEGRREDRPIYLDELSTEVMPGREVLRRRLAEKTLLHMVWMHLYRRDFIERLGLRFVPRLIHEDVLWTTRAFLEAQRVAYDPTPGYFYRQRHRRPAPDTRDKHLEAEIASFAYIARGMTELAAPLREDPELQQLLHWQLVDGALSIFHKLRQVNSPGLRRRLYRQLRRDGVYGLLWNHATLSAQRRRVARSWLKSWMA
ncbi:MAG: glycosyltransferase [Burkholderiales bacterium]|nr:glycosyltransferase [Burkholderiales bacterium]